MKIHHCWKCFVPVKEKGRCQQCKNIRYDHLWFRADLLLGLKNAKSAEEAYQAFLNEKRKIH